MMMMMMISNSNNDDQEMLTVRESKPNNNRRGRGRGIEPDDDDDGNNKEEGIKNQWPPWLRPLLKTSFFVQCKLHADAHKTECNMYCLDCMNGPLCSLCLSYHKTHRPIQVFILFF